MNAYGIWNTTSQRWSTNSEGLIVVFYTLGAAIAQQKETAEVIGVLDYGGDVAEIGDDGEPLEVEHD